MLGMSPDWCAHGLGHVAVASISAMASTLIGLGQGGWGWVATGAEEILNVRGQTIGVIFPAEGLGLK